MTCRVEVGRPGSVSAARSEKEGGMLKAGRWCCGSLTMLALAATGGTGLQAGVAEGDEGLLPSTSPSAVCLSGKTRCEASSQLWSPLRSQTTPPAREMVPGLTLVGRRSCPPRPDGDQRRPPPRPARARTGEAGVFRAMRSYIGGGLTRTGWVRTSLLRVVDHLQLIGGVEQHHRVGVVTLHVAGHAHVFLVDLLLDAPEHAPAELIATDDDGHER